MGWFIGPGGQFSKNTGPVGTSALVRNILYLHSDTTSWFRCACSTYLLCTSMVGKTKEKERGQQVSAGVYKGLLRTGIHREK